MHFHLGQVRKTAVTAVQDERDAPQKLDVVDSLDDHQQADAGCGDRMRIRLIGLELVGTDLFLLSALILVLRSGVELSGQGFGLAFTEGCLQKTTGLTARAAGEAFGFNAGFTIGSDEDFDCFHASPPSSMVSLIEPSARACSVTECPWPRELSGAFAFTHSE